MAFSDIKLGTTIESVEASCVHRGHQVRLVVSSTVLRTRFGAGRSQDDWLG